MLTITLSLLLFSMVAFLVIGSLNAGALKSKEDVFSAASGLDKFRIARTMLAANVSIAGGMDWFLTKGGTVGLQIIIWGPVIIYIGMVLNAQFVKKYAPDDLFDGYGSFTTLVSSLFKNRFTSTIIIIVTSLGSLTVLLNEIYVGMQLLGVLFPSVKGASAGALALIIGAVTSYGVLGGLMGTVRNDWIQNALMFLVALAAVFMVVGQPDTSASAVSAEIKEFPPLPLNLIIWLVVVNLFFIPSQLRFWQIAGAAESREAFVRGTRRAGVQTALLWTAISIVGYTTFLHFGHGFGEFPTLMTTLMNAEGDLRSEIAFTLITVAAFAALVSTADAAIISLGQAAADMFPRKRESVPFYRALIAAVGVISYVLYLVIFQVLGTQFGKVFSSAFSLFILVAPMVGLALYDKVAAKNGIYQAASLAGLFIAFIIVLLSTYGGNFAPFDPLWAGSIGFAVAALGSVVGLAGARTIGRAGEARP